MLFSSKPKYVKTGEHLLKGVHRFLNYRRDLLPEEKVAEIEKLAEQLNTALKERRKKDYDKVSKKVTAVCEGVGGDYRESALAENIEVIFVAVAIAFGIRAYIAQPFKIPTGSMQPTLNGIIAHPTETKPPNPIVRTIDFLRLGRSWVRPVAKQDETIQGFSEFTRFKFFTFTRIHCRSGNTYTVPAPVNQVAYRGPGTEGSFSLRIGQRFEEGEPLCQGYVDTGDQVIVDKVSYHFFPPRRGEVFVFTTKDIRRIPVNPPEMGSMHYIKRLAGLPGDRLEIESGDLHVNGETAREKGFQQVMSKEDGYRGYQGNYTFQVEAERYVALGDNSFNSFDSRGWGTIPKMNLVGRAFIVYWPFNRHWGLIN